jgi:murein DD-endopeptidase MepM/ murein hydrolase activator NlpD
MPSETVRHRKEKKKYSVIVVPSGESSKTKNFSFGKIGFLASMIGSFFVIAGIVLALLVYTPLGRLVPIPNSELEQRYGKQIVSIQHQLNNLLEEMITLRSYNTQLRKALGEDAATADSLQRPTLLTDEAIRQTKSDVAENEPVKGQRDLMPSREESAEYSSSLYAHSSAEINTGSYNFPLVMPADGFISRGFDAERRHFGIDIAGKEGSAVHAAADGNVVFAGWTYDDGYLMIVSHAMGYVTTYKHNQALMKTTGASVRRGDVIALLGNTGKTSSGPHLHFELWKNGIVINPDNYLLVAQ